VSPPRPRPRALLPHPRRHRGSLTDPEAGPDGTTDCPPTSRFPAGNVQVVLPKSSYRRSTRIAFWHSTVEWSEDPASARMSTELGTPVPPCRRSPRPRQGTALISHASPAWCRPARALRPSLAAGAGEGTVSATRGTCQNECERIGVQPHAPGGRRGLQAYGAAAHLSPGSRLSPRSASRSPGNSGLRGEVGPRSRPGEGGSQGGCRTLDFAEGAGPARSVSPPPHPRLRRDLSLRGRGGRRAGV
jgi:hypothetical protein